MPIPKQREKTEYEKVPIDAWLAGTIEEVLFEEKHPFTFNGEVKEKEAVKLKIMLDGYKFQHSSSWMSFSYDDRSRLYSVYLVNLVENPATDMKFDIDNLKGMRIKVMYKTDGNFQNISQIRALGEKARYLLPESNAI